MTRLPDFGYPQTNDVVEPGMYACMNCQENNPNNPVSIYIDKKRKLPKCENCGPTYWFKI